MKQFRDSKLISFLLIIFIIQFVQMNCPWRVYELIISFLLLFWSFCKPFFALMQKIISAYLQKKINLIFNVIIWKKKFKTWEELWMSQIIYHNYKIDIQLILLCKHMLMYNIIYIITMSHENQNTVVSVTTFMFSVIIIIIYFLWT